MATIHTVLGEIDPAEAGITLTHEHIMYANPGCEYDHQTIYDVEEVAAGEQIEPVTEGESVPVPTGEDPAKEGAEETKRSAAALGDPTKAGSVAGEASGGPGAEKEEA